MVIIIPWALNLKRTNYIFYGHKGKLKFKILPLKIGAYFTIKESVKIILGKFMEDSEIFFITDCFSLARNYNTIIE